MTQLGWFDASSEKFKNIRQKIYDAIQERHKRNSTINNCQKNWLVFSEKTKEGIKKYKNALRIQNIWEKINQEDSFRSKIIKSLDAGSYYSSPKYSRGEFRKIMNMK
jgi:hypothetical protein